jgi:hypothetical protein
MATNDNDNNNNDNNNNQLAQTYDIHDNYSRPFKVTIIDNGTDYTVDIQKEQHGTDQDGTPDYNVSNYVPIKSIDKVFKVFVGKSPKHSWSDGNSILLFMGFNDEHQNKYYGFPKYIFIGQEIYSFHAHNIINEYYSPIGNNDVPYPYAIDADNKYYLMGECVIVNNEHKQEDIFKNNHDPYMDYYGHNEFKNGSYLIQNEYLYFNNDRCRQHNTEFLQKYNIKTIYYACIGDGCCENYTDEKCKREGNCDFKKMKINFGYDFGYDLNHDHNYDEFNSKQFAGIYIVYNNTNNTNDKEEILHKMTKQQYITIMSDFANMRGYVPIDKTIIEKRTW